MQTTRTIALSLFQFANDHQGEYPKGRSSTAIFQQLLDGMYVADPKTFYVQMPGKVPPTSQQLKPENVSFDVTTTSGGNPPDGTPLVFLTGYRIHYRSGGEAVPLSRQTAFGIDGLAVCYTSNAAYFRKPSASRSDGSIENFVPPTFVPAGHTFQQLTPEGPLPP